MQLHLNFLLIIIDHKFKDKMEKKRGILKMKKTKIILLATLGLCMLSFMPAALGAAESKPISAFTDTNRNIAAWLDPESGLTILPHGFWLFNGPFGLESIAECDHHGSVLVRELKNGGILYKVNLHVKNASMFVVDQYSLIFVGEMDYHFQVTLIVYDGELSDPVPWLLAIWFPENFPGGPEGKSTFSHLTASGTGAFVNDTVAIELGFAPGATAKVKVTQVGIAKPPEHPQIDPLIDPYNMWPVEFIFFH